MMIVMRGTVTSESAFIQLITLPGAPFISPSTPIRKPGTSTRNTMGTLNESHSTMKLVTLLQASTSSAPPLNIGLLAMKPTLLPSSRASAVTIPLPKRALSSNAQPLSAIASITLRTSYTWERDSGRMSRMRLQAWSEPGGTGHSGGGSLWWLGRYDRKRLNASIAWAAVSTARSASPEMPVSSVQPPSSSGSVGLLIALEVTRALVIAVVEPLRITTKSDIAAYQVEEP